MSILLLGATGRTGRHLARRLRGAGQDLRVLIRDPARRPIFEDLGAQALVVDLREDFSRAFDGIHTVIYAAGSADGEGVCAERAVDRDAIVAAIGYARQYRCQCFVLISTLLAADPAHVPASLRHYAQMKRESDEQVIGSGLDYLILRPATLTDEVGCGAIDLVDGPSPGGATASREDVAHLAVAAWQAGLRNRVLGFRQGHSDIASVIERLTHAVPAH
ncbi:MAG: NAD(P)H-binding protein [Burkholderiaceae bacterium]